MIFPKVNLWIMGVKFEKIWLMRGNSRDKASRNDVEDDEATESQD